MSSSGISTPVLVEASGATSIGRERKKNEDQFLIGHIARTLQVQTCSVEDDFAAPSPESVEGTLMLVADGMGGAGGGDIASHVAVRAVAHSLTRVVPWLEKPAPPREGISSLPGVKARMKQALLHGDQAVQQVGESRGNPRMGTTLTAAYVSFPILYVAHVGDSRCYLLRGDTLFRMTNDHTMAERLRKEIGAEISPSSQWNHVLWNALGGGDDGKTRPEVHRCRLYEGDMLLLCSDGLTKHVADEAIVDLLQQAPTVQEACTTLVAAANADGGTDNVTVVVARFVGDEEHDSRSAWTPRDAQQSAATAASA